MKGIELLEKYPKAAKIISDFYSNKLIASMDTQDVTEEFKEMLKQQTFDNEYVAVFIDSNPRFLFDVFDQNGIYITTPVSAADGPHFRWEIQTDYENVLTEEHETYSSEFLNTRKEAEAVAIEKAFEILNHKL